MKDAPADPMTREERIPKYDRFSVDPNDEMLAAGGRPSPVRSDPYAGGYEDCARNFEPCTCHGDRTCRLGLLMRMARTQGEHLAWLEGRRETPVGPDLMRMAGLAGDWERLHNIKSGRRDYADIWREAWPLLMICARDYAAKMADGSAEA